MDETSNPYDSPRFRGALETDENSRPEPSRIPGFVLATGLLAAVFTMALLIGWIIYSQTEWTEPQTPTNPQEQASY